MQVSRPVVTVVPSPSGKVFTYRVEADSWITEYQARARFDSKAKAAKAAKAFEAMFDTEATAMETGNINRYHIMRSLVEHDVFTARRKVSNTFASLIS